MADCAVISSDTLRIGRAPVGRLVELNVWPGQAAQTAAFLRKVSAPACGSPGTDGRASFATAPGRIMLFSRNAADWPDLADAMPETLGCLTDLSHSRVGYAISGSAASIFLQSLIALDLCSARFPPGKGCATTHHDAPLFLVRVKPEEFTCLVVLSFMQDFETALIGTADGYCDK